MKINCFNSKDCLPGKGGNNENGLNKKELPNEKEPPEKGGNNEKYL